jgi:hypothetical protein
MTLGDNFSLSINVEWFDAHQTIIVAHIGYGWGWSTAQQARVTIQQLAQSVSYPVALIVILPPDVSVPPNGFAQNSKDALQRHAASGLSAVIYVTNNSATQALWESAINMYASPTVNYAFANTFEAAVAILSS